MPTSSTSHVSSSSDVISSLSTSGKIPVTTIHNPVPTTNTSTPSSSFIAAELMIDPSGVTTATTERSMERTTASSYLSTITDYLKITSIVNSLSLLMCGHQFADVHTPILLTNEMSIYSRTVLPADPKPTSLYLAEFSTRSDGSTVKGIIYNFVTYIIE